MELEKMGKQTI
jgi:hypothetical protein